MSDHTGDDGSMSIRAVPAIRMSRVASVIRRLLIICAALGLCALLVVIGWQRAKVRYVMPWLGNYLAHQVERRTGWQLTYRSIGGNLLTEVDLYAVLLQPSRLPAWFTGRASELQVVADHIHATYSPVELLTRHRIRRIEVDRSRLQVGPTLLSFQVAQVGDLTAVSCPTQHLALEELRPLVALPNDVTVEGRIAVGGEWMFRAYQPHLMQMRLHGEDLRIRWNPTLDAHIDADLEFGGSASAPNLSGTIEMTKGRWTGVGTRPLGSALAISYLAWANHIPGTVQVQFNGNNFWLHTEQLHAKLRAWLTLHKRPGQEPRLVGDVEALEGTYNVRNRRFVLRNGSINFADRPSASPELDALLETRIKRYRIHAAVHGTLRDSHLRLTSTPELSQDEIVSLMIFGRSRDRLSVEERDQLDQRDAGSQALDLLFLGQAELLAAKWLGLDEINVTMSENPYGPAATRSLSPIGSVEIGKYVIPDRLFGSYELAPKQTPTDTTKHTVGAEYELSDSFSVGASVKAGMKNTAPDSATPGAHLDPSVASSNSRRFEAEEALIRFRWKF